MKSKSPPPPSDLPELSASQLEIMQEIWKRDEVTVREVWDALRQQRDVARNTILTMMDRLAQKGWLHRRLEAGTHHYAAAATRKRTLGSMLNQMIDKAFSGSSEHLVMTLLEARGLSPEESRRIQDLIDEAQKKGEAP